MGAEQGLHVFYVGDGQWDLGASQALVIGFVGVDDSDDRRFGERSVRDFSDVETFVRASHTLLSKVLLPMVAKSRYDLDSRGYRTRGRSGGAQSGVAGRRLDQWSASFSADSPFKMPNG